MQKGNLPACNNLRSLNTLYSFPIVRILLWLRESAQRLPRTSYLSQHRTSVNHPGKFTDLNWSQICNQTKKQTLLKITLDNCMAEFLDSQREIQIQHIYTII